MREKLNCPNCGAPIRGVECEYCGTMFYDFSSISLDKPTYIRINGPQGLATFRAQATDCSFDINTDSTYICNGRNQRLSVITNSTYTCQLNFNILPDDDGIMLKMMVK